jgi:hypothetical protein
MDDIDKEIDDDYVEVSEPTSDLARSADASEDADAADASEAPSEDESAFGDEQTIIRDSQAAGRPDGAETIREHAFGRRRGSAAASRIDEVIDEEAIVEHDGRADTETFFYPSDASDANEEQYQRLIRIQEGKWSGMKNAQRRADRQRTIGNFCGHLELPSSAQQRVEAAEADIDMSTLGPYRSEHAILAIISLVANQYDRFIRDEDAFRELLRDVDLSLDRLRSLRKIVDDRTEVL